MIQPQSIFFSNPQDQLEEFIESTELTIEIFQLIPQISNFLINEWGWNETISILIAFAAGTIYTLAPIVVGIIVYIIIRNLINRRG